MRKILFVLYLISIIILARCATYQPISYTLDPDTQQRIKTSEIEGVALEFIPHPNGDRLEYPWTIYGRYYTINDPFNGLLIEWAESKFGEVINESNNKLLIEIIDITANTDISSNHSISMKVRMEGNLNDVNLSKNINYYASFSAPDGSFVGQSIRKNIDLFLIKFIIAIDKYVDSKINIKG